MTTTELDLTAIQGLDEPIEVDTSERGRSYLLIAPRGGHLRVSASTRQLLRWVRDGHTFADLATLLSRRQGQEISEQQLENAYQQVIRSLQSTDENSARALSKTFWLRLPLLPARWVERLAAPLAVLFDRRIALAGVLLSLLALAVTVPGGFSVDSEVGGFWSGYLLFLLSLMAHELGHAAACARYGTRPSDIGFTMYLVYPAFYSNVTSAWRLRRWQRVVVDLGGNYFQYLVGVGYVGLFLASGNETFRVAFLMIVFSSAFSLNPIFRFDGYWMMSDALGVVNLAEQPVRLARRAFDRLRGRDVEPLPWTRGVVAALSVYTPLSFAFWAYFLLRLMPFVWTATLSFPNRIYSAVTALVSSGSWNELIALLVPTFILIIIYVMLFRLSRIVWRPFSTWLQTRQAPTPAAST